MIAYVPWLVLLAGLLLYALAAHAKVTTVGLAMFVVGLFWALQPLVSKTVSLAG